MSNNQLGLLIFLGVVTVLVLISIVWTFLPRARTSMANRLEKSIGLAIPDELRHTVGRQATRRSRLSLMGLVLGVWVAVPFVWSLKGDESTGMSTNLYLVVGTMFVGGAIGAAIGSLSRPTRLDKGAIRFARPEAVTLEDYIAPLVRRGAWVVVSLATLIYLTSVILNATSIAPIAVLPPATFGGILVALAIASLVFFEAVSRRIVERAQPTASEPELVWGDAMRSTNVSGLVLAPIALGFYGLVTCGSDFAIGFRNLVNMVVALVTVNVVAWLAILTILFVAVYAITSRPQRHFLKRLWPQYVDVGATAGAKR